MLNDISYYTADLACNFCASDSYRSCETHGEVSIDEESGLLTNKCSAQMTSCAVCKVTGILAQHTYIQPADK